MYITCSACAGVLRVINYQWRGSRSAGICATGNNIWCAAGSYFSSSEGWRGLSLSWRGHGAAAGHHGAAALRRAVARAAVIWCGGCMADGLAVGRRGGDREGRGEGQGRRRGLPFVVVSLHLLGSIYRPDLGLP
jgi:hypothetical protein